ncbi:MAG: dynamin family protein, partial [Acidiferrobacterales bacterium]
MDVVTNISQPLRERLGDYQRWREELITTIQNYQAWIEQEELSNGEDDLRVYELIEALRTDKLTIAIVGEFSRGKTELINAVFFSDYKQRLLPAEAGRTTMCPTELRFDENVPPCLKLLPIESRKNQQTIAELKQTPTYWTTFPLELDSPEKLAEAFREIVKSKSVTIPEAQALGLYDPISPQTGSKVTVPLWRHAVINYPHPLLKDGLVVLDTPGLNSLGSEPELTMSMLPSAHVVVFVLAADTGVTKSDLKVWKDHVCVAKGDADEGRIVVLNKIDTLWDELRGDSAVAASISRQSQESAAALGISKNQVFPVSAQ